MSVAGVLLAAGRSERFGAADKLVHPFRGKPLVAHAADALRHAGCHKLIAVVASNDVAKVLPGFEIVALETPSQLSDSLGEGIARALESQASYAVVALGDMPFVKPQHLRDLIRLASRTGVSASATGDLRCPPACFGQSWFRVLMDLNADHGAKDILAGLAQEQFVVAQGQMLLDIDRHEDLITAKEAASGSRPL